MNWLRESSRLPVPACGIHGSKEQRFASNSAVATRPTCKKLDAGGSIVPVDRKIPQPIAIGAEAVAPRLVVPCHYERVGARRRRGDRAFPVRRLERETDVRLPSDHAGWEACQHSLSFEHGGDRGRKNARTATGELVSAHEIAVGPDGKLGIVVEGAGAHDEIVEKVSARRIAGL